MANSKQAKKRIRQNEVRRLRNKTHRTKMRTVIKSLRKAVEQEDGDAARALLPGALKVIDKTAQKKVIHRNTAARYKSHLTKAVSGLSA